MSTISSHTQNFHTASVSGPSAAQSSSDHGLSKVAQGFAGVESLNGATPFSTSNPGFGSRNGGGFSLGEFLG